jgi:hypothetical protein
VRLAPCCPEKPKFDSFIYRYAAIVRLVGQLLKVFSTASCSQSSSW